MLRRSGLKGVRGKNNTFIVVDGIVVYDKALEVTLTTAPSGFDT